MVKCGLGIKIVCPGSHTVPNIISNTPDVPGANITSFICSMIVRYVADMSTVVHGSIKQDSTVLLLLSAPGNGRGPGNPPLNYDIMYYILHALHVAIATI